MKKSRTKLLSRALRQQWYMIPVALIVVVVVLGFLNFAIPELSVVKIATEYGTLEITESVGITAKSDIIQSMVTQNDVTYSTFLLSDQADVTPVSGFTLMDSSQYPMGVQSGHELIVVFDNNAYTEEAVFFDILVDIGGVRWDQVTIYSGTGQQLKVYQPPPQETAGSFFIFFHQNEVERDTPSLLFQFKGYQTSQSRNVFVSTYYSLAYSYITPETTTIESNTTITDDGGYKFNLQAPDINYFYLIPFLVIITLFKKRKRGDKTIECN